jgi:hypothetical protein
MGMKVLFCDNKTHEQSVGRDAEGCESGLNVIEGNFKLRDALILVVSYLNEPLTMSIDFKSLLNNIGL